MYLLGTVSRYIVVPRNREVPDFDYVCGSKTGLRSFFLATLASASARVETLCQRLENPPKTCLFQANKSLTPWMN